MRIAKGSRLLLRIITVFTALLLLSATAFAGSPAVRNAGFEEIGQRGPASWKRDVWDNAAGSTVFGSSVSCVFSGKSSAYIHNLSPNDARFVQEISCSRSTLYRLSVQVFAKDINGGAVGANLSVEGMPGDTPPSIFDTDGEWKTLELYVRTGARQKQLKLMLRLGYYYSTVTGEAWFDDIRIEPLEALPDGVQAVQLAENGTNPPPQPEDGAGADYTPLSAGIMLAFTVFLFYALKRWLYPAGRNGTPVPTPDGRRGPALLAVLLCAGLALRLLLAWKIPGHPTDMNCFAAWSGRIASTAPWNFYAEDYFCDYPPGYIAVLAVPGLIGRLFGLSTSSVLFRTLLKMPAILCDLGIAVLLYRLCVKKFGIKGALTAAAAAVFNPVLIVDSACWGQVDSVMMLPLMLALRFMVQERWMPTAIWYTAALLLKPQALMFGPIGLAGLIFSLMKKENRRRRLREAGIGAAVSAGMLAAFSLLFQGSQSFFWLIGRYTGTLGSYRYVSLGAMNVYTMLGLDWEPLTPAMTAAGIALMALSCAYCIWLLWKSRSYRTVPLLGAALMMLLFTFGTKMHERYCYAVVLMLLLAAVLLNDRRIWMITAGISVTSFLNIEIILQYGYTMRYEAGGWLITLISAANVLLALWLAAEAWRICAAGRILPPETGWGDPYHREPPESRLNALLPKTDYRMHLQKRDHILIGVLTAVYAVIAFVNLGTLHAPETVWKADASYQPVVFELDRQKQISHFYYYGNICPEQRFSLSFSADGENYGNSVSITYPTNTMFRWNTVDFEPVDARYIRLSAANGELLLNEIAFLDGGFHVLPIAGAEMPHGRTENNDPALLIDEQDTVPEKPSYLHNTYFDEIYHARTAYEHIHGIAPYETTHPPLGKLIIAAGILMFGMNPFGWRFCGTLAGVLMVPVMYLLCMQLFKKTHYAFFGTVLLTFDFMHFAQTRIATIDSYGVLFIMLMYLFMFRYLQMDPARDGFAKTLVPLGLSGLFMGIGIASKWICVYAAVGLAVLFFDHWFRLWKLHRTAADPEVRRCDPRAVSASPHFWKQAAITVAFCLVFFVAVPLTIYVLSYIPHLAPTVNGFGLEQVWQAQESMFRYHSQLTARHSFESAWYSWPLCIRPLWFYTGKYLPQNMVSDISTFGNPAVWWVCLAGVLFLIRKAVDGRTRGDRNVKFLFIGLAAQFVPWMFITRATFIYHYFASIPFIILITLVSFRFAEKKFGSKKAFNGALAVTAAAVLLFIVYYPLISGLPIPRALASILNLMPSWHLF